jgi:thiol-disulfide isomerase/thioredoxin
MIKKISFPLFFIIIAICSFYLYSEYKKPIVHSGELAPDFEFKIENLSYKLSQFRNKWILIHFWGSWCGPCREKNKDLVALYNHFQNKKFKDADSFEIISLGIESKKQAWLNAIVQDQLNWKFHFSHVNSFNCSIAKKYGIKEIPATILINPKGQISFINVDIKIIEGHLSKSLYK